jgi:hypothetical protein
MMTGVAFGSSKLAYEDWYLLYEDNTVYDSRIAVYSHGSVPNKDIKWAMMINGLKRHAGIGRFMDCGG